MNFILPMALMFSSSILMGKTLPVVPNKALATYSDHNVTFARDGISNTVELDVPATTKSLLLEIDGLPNESYIFTQVISPDGRAIVSDVIPPDYQFQGNDKNNVAGFAVHVAEFISLNRSMDGQVSNDTNLLIPNNPKVGVKPGRWRIKVKRLAGPATEKVVRIYQKKKSPPNAKLTLNLYFANPNSRNWSGELMSQANSEVRQIFLQVQAFYKSAGVTIELGEVIDIEYDKRKDIFSYLRSQRGVNIVFVDQIYYAGGHGFASLPGSVLKPDRMNTGVVVEVTPRLVSLHDIAYTWAHELSHYLGLFHTREKDALIEDPLSDTSNDPLVLTNVMNPLADKMPLLNLLLTPQQKAVIHNHPSIE